MGWKSSSRSGDLPTTLHNWVKRPVAPVRLAGAHGGCLPALRLVHLCLGSEWAGPGRGSESAPQVTPELHAPSPLPCHMQNQTHSPFPGGVDISRRPHGQKMLETLQDLEYFFLLQKQKLKIHNVVKTYFFFLTAQHFISIDTAESLSKSGQKAYLFSDQQISF